MSELHHPAIMLLLFFVSRENPAQEGQTLCKNWQPDELRLTAQASSYDHHYSGTSTNGFKIELTCHLAYDTHVLRLICSGTDQQTSHSWPQQEKLLQKIIKQSVQDTPLGYPWGMTWLYHAIIPAQLSQQQLKSELSTALTHPISEIFLEGSQYGWLTLLKEEREAADINSNPPTERTYLSRRLAFLTPQARREQVDPVFLQPMTAGISSIELYLHKATHHLHQYNLLHKRMERTRQEIEQQTLQTLKSFDKSLQSQEKLDEIAKQLMEFLAYKGQAELLLNSLRSNREALQEKLTHAQLINSSSNSPLYLNELAILQRGIEQIKSNLTYATTTQEMAQTIKDLQRSVASAHQERINYRFSMIAALLTSVTIFNSYLDIWSLLLEDSQWTLPDPHVRLALSFGAAITSGLAILCLIQQRIRWGILFMITCLITCGLAYLATLQGTQPDILPEALCTGLKWC